MLNNALQYASFGWYVFPCYSIEDGKCACGEDCKSPGKHPMVKQGLLSATLDHLQIRQWWDKWPTANIGISAGPSKLLVIDVDTKPGSDGSDFWAEIEQTYSFETVEVITGSGGRHIYFKTAEEIGSSISRIHLGIDVRANGGYVIAPPSKHLSGNAYEWEGCDFQPIMLTTAPDWLVELCRRQPQVKVNDAEYQIDHLTVEKVQELRSALFFIDPDNRETWLEIGMALASTGAGNQALGLWTEWSIGSEKFDAKDQRRVWKSFSREGGTTLSSIFFRAKQNGWCDLPGPVVATVPRKERIEERTSISVPPEGMLATISNYILETSIRPQPVLATSAAIALASVVLGRKFAGSTGLRTNIYIIGIAPSGAGKDHPRQCIKDILIACDRADLLGGEEVFSGQGIYTSLVTNPARVFLLDEFGLLLQQSKDQKAGGLARQLLSMLMKLFTSSKSHFLGPEYADQKNRPRIDIHYPCASIFATTTATTFYPALQSDQVSSGFLPRFLVVESRARPPKRKRPRSQNIPTDLVDWILMASAPEGEGNLVGINPATPMVAEKSYASEIIFDELDDLADERMNNSYHKIIEPLWSRAWEIADKLATIAACAADIQRPVVQKDHARWATNFVIERIEWLTRAVVEHVADSSYDATKKSFLRAIIEAGEFGIPIRSLGTFQPFCSYRPKERAQVLEDLKGAGEIDNVSVSIGTGRPRDSWLSIQFLEG